LERRGEGLLLVVGLFNDFFGKVFCLRCQNYWQRCRAKEHLNTAGF
jgi:hypothetical protein